MQPSPVLLQAILEVLKKLPNVTMVRTIDYESDTKLIGVELIIGEDSIRLPLTTKIPPDDAPTSAETQLQPSPSLFIATGIPESLARRLQQRGAFYADTFGNIFISVPGFYAVQQVPLPPRRDLCPVRSKDAVLSPSATRIALRLLYDPGLAKAPLRLIGKTCGIALRSAQIGMATLCLGDCLADLGKGGFKVVDRERLLRKFVDGYNQKLRNKLFLGQFSPVGSTGSPQKLELDGCSACWGGDEGGDRLTRMLSSQEGLVYVYEGHMPVVVKNRLRLNPNGSVALYAACWPREMESMPMVAPWIVVYADLLYERDPRCHEVAQALYEQRFQELPHGE